MKIKYSDKIKETLTPSSLQEIIQVCYSIIPHQQKHIFSFSIDPENHICMTHYIPIKNSYSKLHLINSEIRSIPKEPVIVLYYYDCIYVFLESESPIDGSLIES